MNEQEKYGYEEWAGYESEMKRKRSCLEKIKMKGRKSGQKIHYNFQGSSF